MNDVSRMINHSMFIKDSKVFDNIFYDTFPSMVSLLFDNMEKK